MINRFTVASINTMKRTLAAVAAGREPPDSIIKGARILSTYSERVFEEREIWIHGGRIAAIKQAGSYPLLPGDRTRRYDAQGGIIAPGLVDPLVDLPGSMMSACAYAEAALLGGTTTIVCDCRALLNVFGKRGLKWFLSDACRAPLSVFVRALGVLSERDERDGEKSWPQIDQGNWPTGLVRAGDEGCVFDAFTADDSKTPEDFLEAGEWFMLQGGEGQNLVAALRAVAKPGSSSKRICLCTGGRDAYATGFLGLDEVVRQAVATGTNPTTAWSMASLHPATRYGFDCEVGGLGYARRADLVLLNDDLEVQNTWYGGQLVVENRRITSTLDRALSKRYQYPQVACKTVRIQRGVVLTPSVPDKAVIANVIAVDVASGSVFGHRRLTLAAVDSWSELLTKHQLCFLAVIERSGGKSEVMHGLVQGFGLVNGAVASSISFDVPVVTVAGDNEADMKLALTTLKQSGGGLCAVQGGRVLASVPLPIGGLISDQRAPDLVLQMEQLKRAWTELGCTLPIPCFNRLMNDMRSEILLTGRGLVLAPERRVVPLFEPIIDATV